MIVTQSHHSVGHWLWHLEVSANSIQELGGTAFKNSKTQNIYTRTEVRLIVFKDFITSSRISKRRHAEMLKCPRISADRLSFGTGSCHTRPFCIFALTRNFIKLTNKSILHSIPRSEPRRPHRLGSLSQKYFWIWEATYNTR